MSITHHPDDATLLEFVAGSLSEPLAIVVASHLELCARCRAAVPMLAEAGGALMLEAGPAGVEENGAFERLLARIDEPAAPSSRLEQRCGPTAKVPGDLPGPLARLIGGGLDDIIWRSVIPGADDFQLFFKTKNGDHALRFLMAQPGRELPEHSHAGTELTLVLRGALKDGARIFTRGDITDMDDEGTHNPAVYGDEICICVIANEGPPRFTAPEMQNLQKLIGI